MIMLDGVAYITGREAAELLAPDVSTVLIANWVHRDLLKPIAKLDGANIYRYADILAVEERTRSSPRGRNRRRSNRTHPSLLKIDRTAIISEQMPAVDPALFMDVVYYLRFADRIKIGYTGDLTRRLGQIPHDELLATEPGSLQLERLRQRQFSQHLVPGQREWFHISNVLIEHIAMLIGHFGRPGEFQANTPVGLPVHDDQDPRRSSKSSPWWAGASPARR